MAFNVNQINAADWASKYSDFISRNSAKYASNDSVLFNADTGKFEKAGLRHKIGCFFGTAASKERNNTTLEAVKAMLNSTGQFKGIEGDIDRSLGRINMSKTIDYGTIKSHCQELQELAKDSTQEKFLSQRLTLKLAGCSDSLPPGWKEVPEVFEKHCQRNFKEYAKEAGSYAAVKPEDIITKNMPLLQTISDLATSDNKFNHNDFVHLLVIFDKGVNIPVGVKTVDEAFGRIVGEAGFTESEKANFDRVRQYLQSQGKSDVEVLAMMLDSKSVANRLMLHPQLCSSPEMIDKGYKYLAAFDEACGKPTMKAGFSFHKFGQIEIREVFLPMLERFIMEDFAHQATHGKEPSIDNLKADLTNGTNKYLGLVKEGFMLNVEIPATLFRLEVDQRLPVMAALTAFNNFEDSALFNRLIGKLDKICELYAVKGFQMTDDDVFAAIEGEGKKLPENLSAEDRKKYYFNQADSMDIERVQISTSNELAAKIQMFGSLVVKYGFMPEQAYDVLNGKMDFPSSDKLLNKFLPPVLMMQGANAEMQMAMDLNRKNEGYVLLTKNGVTFAKDNREVAPVKMGANLKFNLPEGDPVNINTWEKRHTAKSGSGGPDTFQTTDLSREVRGVITNLCGKFHTAQIDGVMLALGQGGMEPMRVYAGAYGIKASEHSGADYEIKRLENGAVEIRISQPEGCPLEFNWTITVQQNGAVDMSDVHMKRIVD